ncbi:FecR family protein [Mangrovibacterium marinum]|nr:FecR domain-containing protein [Mangrovibacterium marinum]
MLFLKTSKIAAFLILAAFVGGILTWIHKTPETLKWTTITLQRGECRVIILPDSSQVQLAPASTLSYPLHFGKEQREVHLDGEAYFDVRKDRQKPFIVSTQSSRLEVTGTSFNMSSYSSDDQDVIMLVEGGVKLNFFDQAGAQTGQIELKPYQKAVYDKVSQEVTDSRFRDSDLNDWSHRKLSFRNERFVDLAKTLERYYDVDIIFKNKALQEILLNGDFEKETLIDILETIKLLTPFSYQLDTSTNTIYLSAL